MSMTAAVVSVNRRDLDQFHPPPDVIIRVNGPLTTNFFVAELHRLHVSQMQLTCINVYDHVPIGPVLADVATFFRQLCPFMAARCYVDLSVNSALTGRQRTALRPVGTGGISQRDVSRICPRALMRVVR
jgi:hypothetical protein